MSPFYCCCSVISVWETRTNNPADPGSMLPTGVRCRKHSLSKVPKSFRRKHSWLEVSRFGGVLGVSWLRDELCTIEASRVGGLFKGALHVWWYSPTCVRVTRRPPLELEYGKIVEALRGWTSFSFYYNDWCKGTKKASIEKLVGRL